MTLDKFGRHISKRAKIDPTVLADNVIENVEQTIISNFSRDEKYIENKIIQGVHSKVENVDTTLKNLNKMLTDNNKLMLESVKIYGDDQINIKNNIKENEKLIINISNKYENDIKLLKKEVGRFEDLKNEIIKDSEVKQSSEINNLKQEISNELATKFQSFVNKIYERIKGEVTNFQKIHDKMDQKTRDIDRSLTLHLMVHKKDVDKINDLNQQITTVLSQITEIKNSVGKSELDLKSLKDNLVAINSVNEKMQSLLDPNQIKKDRIEFENIKTNMHELKQNIINITKSDLMKITEEINSIKAQDIAQISHKLEKKINDMDEKFSADIVNLNKNYDNLKKQLIIQISDFELELQITKDNIFKKIEDLNKLVQQSAEVSRAEFNATMKLAREELNSTVGDMDKENKNRLSLAEQKSKSENSKLSEEISSLNTKVASLENKITDLAKVK